MLKIHGLFSSRAYTFMTHPRHFKTFHDNCTSHNSSHLITDPSHVTRSMAHRSHAIALVPNEIIRLILWNVYFLFVLTEGLSNLELKLLRQFLPHNMNIASPSFRQEMFGSLKRIVVRIRDSR